jgi:hypothetical protein
MARALAPVVVLTTACGAVAGTPSGSPTPSPTLASAPAQVPPPSLTQQKVDAALSRLDGFVRDAMSRTGVGPSGTFTKVTVEHLNDNGLGTFTKPSA